MIVVSGKSRLLDELHQVKAEVTSAVRSLPPEILEQGRYEGGWNGRQIVGHLASMEWTYPRLIQMARGELPAPIKRARGCDGSRPIDNYNARQVERREGIPLTDLLQEFEWNRDLLIAAVTSAGDALFEVYVRSAGGTDGSLARVLRFVAVEHVREHLADLRGS